MASNALNIIPGLLGLGTQIATAIPGLRKPKKVDTSKTVAQMAPGVAGAAVGAAQAGHGASRGLALREGLRAAATNVSKVAEQARLAAASDAVMNQQNMEARNQRLADFGSAAAGGLSQVAMAALSPEASKTDEPGTSAVRMKSRPEDAAFGAEQTQAGAEPEAPGAIDDPEVEALQDEVEKVRINAQLAEQGDPSVAGPSANFASTERLEQLRAKSPTIGAPELEADLDHRLRAKSLMLQDAERFGIPLQTVIARINRKLQLRPGQSTQNPYGVSLAGGEEE